MNSVDSCECSKSELDLFTVPPTNISMERGIVTEYIPISSIGDNSPIEFNIPGGEDYIDLGRTFLYLKVKLYDAKENKVLAAGAKVGPVNLWLHSLFSQVDVKLNDKLVTNSINTYAYKAYYETLLSYGTDAKDTRLSSEMWYKDSEPFNEVDPHRTEGEVNSGFAARGKATGRGKEVEMMGRLHCDIFQQDRYLLSGVDMNIKLIRAPEAFHLMAAAGSGFKTIITEASLFVRKVRLNPTITLEHNTQLSQGMHVKYPVRRGVVTTFTIPRGNQSINKDGVVLGQLPRRLVVGLVTNKAFNGDLEVSPFQFEHFNLNYLSLYVDGDQYPSKPLTPNYDAGLYLRSYMSLFEGTGMMNADRGHGINRDAYKDGYVLYAFDLTPDMAEGGHVDPIKHGSLRMDLHFKKALASTVNVVVYAEYDNVIQIDRARNIILDF